MDRNIFKILDTEGKMQVFNNFCYLQNLVCIHLLGSLETQLALLVGVIYIIVVYIKIRAPKVRNQWNGFTAHSVFEDTIALLAGTK